VKGWGRRPKKGCPFSTHSKYSPFQGGRARPHSRKRVKRGTQTTSLESSSPGSLE